jgi:hypothetical protein
MQDLTALLVKTDQVQYDSGAGVLIVARCLNLDLLSFESGFL